MTDIKIFSLYGQFILEQKIIATTIIINKLRTRLKKYEMVICICFENKIIYSKLSLSLGQIFPNVLVSFVTLEKHNLIVVISCFTSNKPKYETTGGD